jgi:cell division septal protein FtsQ
MRKKTKKTVKKRKRVPDKKQTLPFLKIFLKALPYLFFIGVSFLLYRAGGFILFDSGYFTIKNIEIADQESAQAGAVASKLFDISKGNNIFNQDLKELEYTIARMHPELKEIVVQRLLPDTIRIAYEQRKPVCQVQSGYYYLVSDDGVILPHPQARQQPGLIVISGLKVSGAHSQQSARFNETLKRAIDIVMDIQESDISIYKDRIVEINIFDMYNPALFLDDNTRIEIGEYSFKDKAKVLVQILDELKSKNRQARAIDLRFDDIVVVPR